MSSESKFNNIIVESTISNCIQPNNQRIVSLYYGNIGIYSTNISKNIAYGWSGARLEYPSDIGVVNYSTFEGNVADKGFICLGHHLHTSSSYKDYMCNIVANNQSDSRFGTIYSVGSLTIENCTVLGPHGNGKAFSANDNNVPVHIINCNIDEFSTYSGSYTTSGIKITNSLNILSHLSTYQCIAEHVLQNIIWHNNNIKSFQFCHSIPMSGICESILTQ